jgi:hypothetical protein
MALVCLGCFLYTGLGDKMITGKAPIWVSAQEGGIFVSEVCQQLETAGYQVVRSFDLQNGKPIQLTDFNSEDVQSNCGCRMVVVLVYGQSGPPVSLMFLGTSEKTSLYLTDGPPGGTGTCNCASIANLLSNSLESYDSVNS